MPDSWGNRMEEQQREPDLKMGVIELQNLTKKKLSEEERRILAARQANLVKARDAKLLKRVTLLDPPQTPHREEIILENVSNIASEPNPRVTFLEDSPPPMWDDTFPDTGEDNFSYTSKQIKAMAYGISIAVLSSIGLSLVGLACERITTFCLTYFRSDSETSQIKKISPEEAKKSIVLKEYAVLFK